MNSPGELSIEDSTGRVIGVRNEKGMNDFPMAVYDQTQKFVKILAAEDRDYTYIVTGTGSGKYGINITIKKGNNKVIFKGRDIPTTVGEKHTYIINKTALVEGKTDAVTINVQKGGVNKIIKTGSSVDGEIFNKK